MVRNSTSERTSPTKPQPPPLADDAAPKTTQRKTRKRLPTTPEPETVAKPIRRSKRLSDENEQVKQASPHKAAHARSHAKHVRSPSPFNARPVTIEKKRKKGAEGVEEEKIMRIQLPFADTPVIKRNKEMRKGSAEGNRRSSSGMRGKRASSLIDEGRGNGELSAMSSQPLLQFESFRAHSAASTAPAPDTSNARSRSKSQSNVNTPGLSTPPPSGSIRAPRTPHILRFTNAFKNIFADDSIPPVALPHSEVPSAEFYKHISAELTEPRRMRCLLGWCGTRALPPKPEAPKEKTEASSLEFQALQAGTLCTSREKLMAVANRNQARVIQEELASDLVTRGILSDWFSRDDDAPLVAPLRKRPNPRNVANAAKAEELERELERYSWSGSSGQGAYLTLSRLKTERSEWDALIASAAPPIPSPSKSAAEDDGDLSPLHSELLDSPQRSILEQLQQPQSQDQQPISSTSPLTVQSRLRTIASNLEFTVDQFAHGVHALSIAKDTADRLADRSLDEAADVLQKKETERRTIDGGKGVDAMDALRGLARVLNGKGR